MKRPAAMTAGEINRRLDALDGRSSKLCDRFIAAGRGNETPAETREKSDPLARAYCALQDERDALRGEVERRCGPNPPRRLPRGFGPLR